MMNASWGMDMRTLIFRYFVDYEITYPFLVKIWDIFMSVIAFCL